MGSLREDVFYDEGDILYGPHTVASSTNSPTGIRVGEVPAVVRAYAWIKRAYAETSVELGILDPRIGHAISKAADDVASGDYMSQFPSPVAAGGGGTATNMNFNEVIATLAGRYLGEAVHPNDHVNNGQSSNDTYPTAVALTLLQEITSLLEAIEALEEGLREKADQYEGVDHLGRTCLNDAVALPISATHRAQAAALHRTRKDLQASVAALASVPLGGTVVGTGVGASPRLGEEVARRLSLISGIPVAVAPDIFDAMANSDPYAAVGAAARRLSTVIHKISSDIRLLASGPQGGFGEISLPKIQAGSSIMPGKVNPTVPEAAMLCMLRVRSAAYLIEEAVDSAELEINVMLPVVLEAALMAFQNLRDGASLLNHKCVSGMTWNMEVVERHLAYTYDSKVETAMTGGYDMEDPVEATRA